VKTSTAQLAWLLLVLAAQQTPLEPVVAPSALPSQLAPLAEQLAQLVLALHAPE
jgi:hypothetical protein